MSDRAPGTDADPNADDRAGAQRDLPSHGEDEPESGLRERAHHPSRLLSHHRTWRSPRLLAIGAVVVVTGSLGALFGFGLVNDPTLVRSPLVGRQAPAFTLRTLDGQATVRLADLHGQVVVINFWASWCAACREEHPALLAAWQRYRDQGVVLLGIDYQDRVSAAQAFMREMGGDWPTLADPGSRTALSYGVYGVPETFFIGPDGIIRHKQIGPSSYELLTDQIQELLGERGGSDTP